MELCLRWLDWYERWLGEDQSIGLIRCGEKNRKQIELLQLDRGEIRVAEYLVEPSPKGLREASLCEAMRLTRGRSRGFEITGCCGAKIQRSCRLCGPGLKSSFDELMVFSCL
jgi:hypothetical protein